MFDILFGWSKASKCKKAIKRARCRLRLLKNKREAKARQQRKDLAELVQSGHEETALNRVEQLVEDESVIAAYELLDHFCELILTQLFYIKKHKDCPNDINEAVSSLIFASARCGEVPELCAIRKLFGQRYGPRFATTAVELLPGNLVNKQLRENLSRKPVPDDLKYRVVDKIARDNCLQQQVLAIEYFPNWQQMQVNENKGYQLLERDAKIYDTVEGSEVHTSEVEEIKRNVTIVNSSISKPIVSEEMVHYVDGIGEYQNSAPKVGAAYQDQISWGEKTQFGYDNSDIDQDESQSEKSSIRTYRKSKRASKKRSRRRSSSLENIGINIMDIGYMIYYHKPCRSTQYSRKHQKPSLEGISPSCFAKKRLMLHSFSEKEKNLHSCQREDGTRKKTFSFEMSGCSLNQPCYFCLYDKDGSEALSMKPKRGIRETHEESCHCQPFWDHELDKEMEFVAIPRRSNRKSYSAVTEISASSNISSPRTSDSSSRIEIESTYSRAMSLPEKRNRKDKGEMLRTYSCPSQHPNHVHPKLPEYDDLAAKFIALKRDRLEKGSIVGTKTKVEA